MACVDCDDNARHGSNRPGEEHGGRIRRLVTRATTLSTTGLRSLWAPACKAKGAEFLAAYAALDACFKAYRYKVRREDTGAYNCRRITGGTGYSLHSYGPADSFTFWTGVKIRTALAIDVNWLTNPYGRRPITDMPPAMIAAIKKIRTRSGKQVWRWGGDYGGNKDAMHFEIACSPRDLATGIDPATVPGARHHWTPIKPGDSDAIRGGQDVAEAQRLLAVLAHRWNAPDLNPGDDDGEYGPTSQAATSAFKSRMIRLQAAAGQTVWPDSNPYIGPKVIAALREKAR